MFNEVNKCFIAIQVFWEYMMQTSRPLDWYLQGNKKINRKTIKWICMYVNISRSFLDE